jgi:WD40 repeat protein
MTGLDGEGVRVVLVGTGSHAPGSRLPDVAAVADTVEALRACLIEVCGVREPNLAWRLDPDGPEPFLDMVLAAASAATDALVLYYVGHGVLNVAGKLHLATRATVDLTTKASFQALAYSEIVGALSSSRARRVLVVLDCCFSGRATVPVRSGALLASADRDEQALVPVGERYTAFSGELIHALREGIPTAPAVLTLHHLYDQLSRTLTRQGRVKPVLQTGNLAMELGLAPNRADRSQDSPAPDLIPWEGECPYRGLEPFTAEDEQLFHGRTELVGHLLARLGERVRGGGITLVAGPSGSGKTSLLLAGVLPAIGHGDLGMAGSSSWPQLTLPPGEDPLRALAAQLVDLDASADVESVRADLTAGSERARAAIRRAASRARPPHGDARLVLVVDQFEELFADAVSDSSRREFIAALDAIAARTSTEEPAAVVILGLRADFTGHCARFPELVAALENNQLIVGPMTTAELRSAIVEPAEQAGLALESGLVTLLLRETGADPDDDRSADYDPGALPLLSHALLTTWQRRRGNLLTVDGYRQAGGVAGAISATAERTFTELEPEVRETARGLLLRMVRIGDDIADTRRRVRTGELLDTFSDRTAATAALEAFAGSRLVTVDRDTAEITHEALLRSWSRLRGWISDDRAGRLLDQEIETAAGAWHHAGGDTALLYRGSRLAAATQRAAETEFSGTARSFLARSTRHERRGVWLRRGAVAVLVALVVFAFQQRSSAVTQRNNAIADRLVTAADVLQRTDQSLGAQLDVEAYHLHPTPELATRLLASQDLPLSRPLTGHTDSVNSASFSPDGHTLATGSDDGSVRLWDTSQPTHAAPLGQLPAGPVNLNVEVAFSPDGHTLAAAGGDGTVRLWDVSQPSHPVPVGQPLTGSIEKLAFSRDGHTLATGSGDGTVRLWDVSQPAHPALLSQPLTGQYLGITVVTFSPDGHTLVTASGSTVRLWDVSQPAHPALLGQPLTTPDDQVEAVAFSPDGHTLATACAAIGGAAYGADHLWDVTQPAQPYPLGRASTGNTGTVEAVAFSPDGHTLAAGSDDHMVRLWHVTGLAGPPDLIGQPLAGHDGQAKAVAFSPDGRTLATGGTDFAVRLWALPPGEAKGPADWEDLGAVAFSPDGHTLAGNFDGPVQLWDVSQPTRPTPLGPPFADSDGLSVAEEFSPDGHALATSSNDGRTQLWNVRQPTHPVPLGPPLASHAGLVTSLAYSPDGHTLATENGDAVQLWDVSQPTHPALVGQTLAGHDIDVGAVAFSADGHTLATGGGLDRAVRLWDVSQPTHPTPLGQPLTGHTAPITVVAFSPDGHTLATAGVDHTVRLWDVSRPAHPALLGQPLTGATDSVEALAFSPDGQTLATGSKDHTVRLWDLSDPAHLTPLGQPLTSTAASPAVAFSPDGHTLATGGDEDTVRLWNMDVDTAINRICTAAGDTLTPAQWKLYAPDLPPTPLCRS